MDLCKYKDILGKPNTGIHKYRLFDIAIFDVLTVLIGAFFISYFLKLNFLYVTIIIFLLGIFAHRLFCVRSTIDKFLFPSK
jgi:hypothetical protein